MATAASKALPPSLQDGEPRLGGDRVRGRYHAEGPNREIRGLLRNGRLAAGGEKHDEDGDQSAMTHDAATLTRTRQTGRPPHKFKPRGATKDH